MVAIAQEQAILESQVDSRKVEQRKLEITIKEVDALPEGTKCYTSVGRMYVVSPLVLVPLLTLCSNGLACGGRDSPHIGRAFRTLG